MGERPFDRGGLIPGGPARIVPEVGECFIRADDMTAGRYVCCRRDSAHLYASHPDYRPLRARDGVSPACSDDCKQALGHDGGCDTERPS